MVLDLLPSTCNKCQETLLLTWDLLEDGHKLLKERRFGELMDKETQPYIAMQQRVMKILTLAQLNTNTYLLPLLVPT